MGLRTREREDARVGKSPHGLLIASLLLAGWVENPRSQSDQLHGNLVYFAAWKRHIGFYPPVSGDEELCKQAAVYAGEKGNLQFPLDQPIPYGLISRIVKVRVQENLARAEAKGEQARKAGRRDSARNR
jgi:hypothetical protein